MKEEKEILMSTLKTFQFLLFEGPRGCPRGARAAALLDSYTIIHPFFRLSAPPTVFIQKRW